MDPKDPQVIEQKSLEFARSLAPNMLLYLQRAYLTGYEAGIREGFKAGASIAANEAAKP